MLSYKVNAPIAVFAPPVLFWIIAFAPIAVLPEDSVDDKAYNPIAVLSDPFWLAAKLSYPKAVFAVPSFMLWSDPIPTPVFAPKELVTVLE